MSYIIVCGWSVLIIIPQVDQFKCWHAYSLLNVITQGTRGVDPMPVYSWTSVCDGGPTLYRHWVNPSCLLVTCANLTIHHIEKWIPLLCGHYMGGFIIMRTNHYYIGNLIRGVSATLPFKRGPRVVVSTAAFHARVRGSAPGLGGLKKNKKCFFPIHVWKSVLWGASVTER